MFVVLEMLKLMMEAARTSELSVNFYQTTWHYNPEDGHLHVKTTFHFLELQKLGQYSV
jgi:hypothetical protein